jgi:hypothetical protein
MDNQQLPGLLGLFGDGERASSTTLLVHTPQPSIVALMPKFPPTKKKRNINESMEGQV